MLLEYENSNAYLPFNFAINKDNSVTAVLQIANVVAWFLHE
jgi:hypothetical protein